MKKSIWKSTIWTMAFAGILGGCGHIEGDPQGIQFPGNATSRNGVVILDSGTDLVGTAFPENEMMSDGVSASGSGTASGGVSALGSGTVSGSASNLGSETSSNGVQDSGAGGNSGIISMRNQPGTTDSVEEEMMKAYQAALENYYTNDILPNGVKCGTSDNMMEGSLSMEGIASIGKTGNCFAILDIDFDGKEELIIQHTNTAISEMREMTFKYNDISGEVEVEFSEFPALTYYDNGIVKVEMPQTHRSGGVFSSYSIYIYAEEADAYAEMGGASAWDRNFIEEDYYGNPFPEDIDVNGDGIVYYVMGGKYKESTIVDLEEYNQWWDSIVDGAKEIEVPFRTLQDYAESYAVCTSKSVWEVERFARKIKELILLGDFQGLSGEIAYPVTIDGMVYQDEEAFLKADFAGKLNPATLEELEVEPCREMFANGQGIMLGNGCVWIGEPVNDDLTSQGLKVIALNGFTSTETGK